MNKCDLREARENALKEFLRVVDEDIDSFRLRYFHDYTHPFGWYVSEGYGLGVDAGVYLSGLLVARLPMHPSAPEVGHDRSYTENGRTYTEWVKRDIPEDELQAYSDAVQRHLADPIVMAVAKLSSKHHEKEKAMAEAMRAKECEKLLSLLKTGAPKKTEGSDSVDSGATIEFEPVEVKRWWEFWK